MHQSAVKELIELSRQNDAQAFKKLVQAHQSMVYTLAFRLLYNEEDAKDIVQETFIRVWKHLDNFKPELKFTTWLFTIASNLCYDKLKKAKHNFSLSLDDQNLVREFISNENIESNLINTELAHIISSLTGNLTPKQKLVFTLRDLEGIEIEEITSITGLSAEKIKSNLYLARQYIRKMLENL